MRLWCGRNRISPDDRREEPRSISTDRRSLPKAARRGGYAGCGFIAGKRTAPSAAPTRTTQRMCRDEAGASEMRPWRRRGRFAALQTITAYCGNQALTLLTWEQPLRGTRSIYTATETCSSAHMKAHSTALSQQEHSNYSIFSYLLMR